MGALYCFSGGKINIFPFVLQACRWQKNGSVGFLQREDARWQNADWRFVGVGL
jgi:hypothetical protein